MLTVCHVVAQIMLCMTSPTLNGVISTPPDTECESLASLVLLMMLLSPVCFHTAGLGLSDKSVSCIETLVAVPNIQKPAGTVAANEGPSYLPAGPC